MIAQSPSVALVSSSVSPPKHSSQKHSVLIEHHLAEKLEELLFNMSVQQREFSKLSRTSSSLFRTLVPDFACCGTLLVHLEWRSRRAGSSAAVHDDRPRIGGARRGRFRV